LSIFKDQEAVKCLSSLHDKYVIVPADKASNNIVFVCKSYYFECLIKELGINNNTSSNTIYKPTSFHKDEILATINTNFVNYTKFIPCRVEHSKYIYQLKNHVRNGACSNHWSTTGFILYGWPNKELYPGILNKKDRNKRHSSPFINVVKGVFFVVRVTLVPVSYLSAPSVVHNYRVPGKFIDIAG
jgi:hypothetical protein